MVGGVFRDYCTRGAFAVRRTKLARMCSVCFGPNGYGSISSVCVLVGNAESRAHVEQVLDRGHSYKPLYTKPRSLKSLSEKSVVWYVQKSLFPAGTRHRRCDINACIVRTSGASVYFSSSSHASVSVCQLDPSHSVISKLVTLYPPPDHSLLFLDPSPNIRHHEYRQTSTEDSPAMEVSTRTASQRG